jgi:DNA (cytosine-5)-methyltransferase 1
MKHGSLFSGIGGFDLASEWMGWENVFHCEIAEFPRKVLNYYWPNAKTHEDITKTDFTIYRGTIDILTGGFPCQPYSAAGKRLGKEDSRHLWPQMLRAIQEIKPRWIVGENVAGFLTWNDGLVFREVCTDLENEGYEVQAFIIPACAVGAPHRRDRVWIVANANGSRNNNTNRTKRDFGQYEDSQQTRNRGGCKITGLSYEWTTTNAAIIRFQRKRKFRILTKAWERAKKRFIKFCNIQHKWKEFPTKSPICSGNDGFSHKLDGITFSKWRNESIKGYGNAVVPQVVHKIFQAIQHIEQ